MIRDLSWTTLGLAFALIGAPGRAAAVDDPGAREREQGRACIDRFDWEGAIGHLDLALAARPDDAGALVDRGRCHARRDDKARARADLDRAIALAPTLAAAWSERGQLRAEDADPAPALADLGEALRLDPNQDEARLTRVGLEMMRDDHDAALADCDVLIARRAEGSGPASEMRALIRLARRDGAGAAADFDEAIRRETLLDTTWMVNLRAMAHLLAGRGDLARASLDQLLEREPGDSTGRMLRCLLNLNLGRPAQARADVEVLLAANPDDPNALSLALPIAGRERRFADALAIADRLVEAQPDRPRHLVTRGAAREDARDLDGALADYQRVLDGEPDRVTVADRANALARQAWIWATAPADRLRDGPRALRVAEQACALTERPTGVALQARAAALAEVGRFDEAIRAAEQAREARRARPDPPVPEITLHRGRFALSFEGEFVRAGSGAAREPDDDRPIAAYRQHRPYRDRR